MSQCSRFHHAAHGGENFVFGDQHMAVDSAAADIERDESGSRLPAVLSESVGCSATSMMLPARRHSWSTGEFAAQHPTISVRGRDGFEISADAADQSAAADGDEDGVELRKLPVEFHGDSALTGYHVEIVVGRDEHAARFFRRAPRRQFGSKRIVARDCVCARLGLRCGRALAGETCVET